MKTERFNIVLRSIAGIPLAFYGYAFQKAWISIESVPAGALIENPGFIPSGVLNALLVIILGCLALKFDSTKLRRTILIAGVTLQLVSAGMLVYALQMGSTPLMMQVAFQLADSAGTSLLSALWIDLFSLLNPVRVAYLNAVTIIVAQGLIFIVEGNELWRIVPTLIAFSLIGGVLYFVAARSGAKENPPASASKARFLFPYKAVLFIAVYAFAYGLASQGANVVSARYTAVIPACIVLAFIFLNTRRFNISMLLRIAFPLMVAGFLLVSLIPGELHEVSSVMLYAGFSTVEMLLLLIVCTISYSSGTSAIWLFGVLGGTQFLMRAVGTAFGAYAVSSLGSAEYTAVTVLSIVLVGVASLTLASEKSLFSVWGGSKAKPEDPTDPLAPGSPSVPSESNNTDASSLEMRINTISSAYSLTDRETEVFYLAMKGKSNSQIARDMFISVGTVKAHLYHIYQKLGIHSRKELFALVEHRK